MSVVSDEQMLSPGLITGRLVLFEIRSFHSHKRITDNV